MANLCKINLKNLEVVCSTSDIFYEITCYTLNLSPVMIKF